MLQQTIWPPENHLPGFLRNLNKSSVLYQDLLFQFPADPASWWTSIEGLDINAVHANDYIRKNVAIVKVSEFIGPQWS